MNKYRLIEDEVERDIDFLPTFYKKLQYKVSGEKEDYFNSSSIYVKSERHQTNNFVAARFYKPITLLNI